MFSIVLNNIQRLQFYHCQSMEKLINDQKASCIIPKIRVLLGNSLILMLDIERTSSLIWRFEADGTAQTFGLHGRHLYLKDLLDWQFMGLLGFEKKSEYQTEDKTSPICSNDSKLCTGKKSSMYGIAALIPRVKGS